MYLERYKNGEYEQVWDELFQLKGEIRQEPLYSAALAVATETMQRAKTNVLILIDRLKAIDYNFVFPDKAIAPLEEKDLELIKKFEETIGPLPLSIRMWFEIVGSVNFIGEGRRPATFGQKILDPDFETVPNGHSELLYDPLQIEFEPFDFEYYLENPNDLERRLDISGDSAGKAGYSGGVYSITVPDAAIDTIFSVDSAAYLDYLKSFNGGELTGPEGSKDWDFETRKSLCNTTFVTYLRKCFKWGGFPGLEGSKHLDYDTIEYLTKGLLPL